MSDLGLHKSGTNTNDATATASDILNEKTAYIKGVKVTGTQSLASLTADATATAAKILPGYTAYVNGAKLTGNATADATATASDILPGKTAYVNGTKVTGNSAATIAVSGSFTQNFTAATLIIPAIIGKQHVVFQQPSGSFVTGINAGVINNAYQNGNRYGTTYVPATGTISTNFEQTIFESGAYNYYAW